MKKKKLLVLLIIIYLVSISYLVGISYGVEASTNQSSPTYLATDSPASYDALSGSRHYYFESLTGGDTGYAVYCAIYNTIDGTTPMALELYGDDFSPLYITDSWVDSTVKRPAIVGANLHQTTFNPKNVEFDKTSGNAATYYIEFEYSNFITLGFAHSGNLASSEVFDIYHVYTTSGTKYCVEITQSSLGMRTTCSVIEPIDGILHFAGGGSYLTYAHQSGSLTYRTGFPSVESDQTYGFIIARQRSSNSLYPGGSYSIKVFADSLAPTISNLEASPSAWTNVNDFNVSFSCSDPSGSDDAYCKIGSAPSSDSDWDFGNSNNVAEGTDILNIDGISVFQQGKTTLYVWNQDHALNNGYSNAQTVNIFYDNQAPANPINLNAIPSDWTNETFDISWENPVDTSGIVGAYYKLDEPPEDNTDGDYIAGDDIESINDLIITGDQTHTLYLWLKDNASNIDYNKYATVQLKYDGTDPAAPSNLAANPISWSNTNDFDLSWLNPSETSGIAGAYYKLDNPPSNEADGFYTAQDNIQGLSSLTVSKQGITPVYVWLQDRAGNRNHTNLATTNFYFDNGDPQKPIELTADPSSWTETNSFNISWTNPIDTSGYAGAFYKIGNPPFSDTDGDYVIGDNITYIDGISVDSEGVHTVYIWLRDNAGNVQFNNYESVNIYYNSTDNPQLNIPSSSDDDDDDNDKETIPGLDIINFITILGMILGLISTITGIAVKLKKIFNNTKTSTIIIIISVIILISCGITFLLLNMS